MDFGGYGVVICVLLGLIQFAIYIIYSKRKKNVKRLEVAPGTVVLYQIGRGPEAPSSSPFPLKLETYLRMNKIPYMNDHSATFSKKSKTPWMTYNGEAIADSQFCIDFLADTLHLNPSAHLSDKEKATARAFQKLLEENFYWTMCHEMFMKKENKEHIASVMPYTGLKLWFVLTWLSFNLKKEMWGHGIGRHTDEEIWYIAEHDLRAVASFLENNRFMMGDEPCEVDCAVFGMIAQVRWHMPGSRHEKLLHDELTNLVAYCDRMKDRYWPDWDQHCRSSKLFNDDSGKIYFQDGATL
ncbi:failed axon connections homolog [Gigantopelta aegis]|uniref:failed axon connections homolog n=1 Tax=Gigantopelta aegis TaxID=1735272 RepID=UPI001B889B3D|nr:failed axon connections homolog [Gigantopelta aegis]